MRGHINEFAPAILGACPGGAGLSGIDSAATIGNPGNYADFIVAQVLATVSMDGVVKHVPVERGVSVVNLLPGARTWTVWTPRHQHSVRGHDLNLVPPIAVILCADRHCCAHRIRAYSVEKGFCIAHKPEVVAIIGYVLLIGNLDTRVSAGEVAEGGRAGGAIMSGSATRKSGDVCAQEFRSSGVVEAGWTRDVPGYLLGICCGHVGRGHNDLPRHIDDFFASILQVDHYVRIVSVDRRNRSVIVMRCRAEGVTHRISQTANRASVLRINIRAASSGRRKRIRYAGQETAAITGREMSQSIILFTAKPSRRWWWCSNPRARQRNVGRRI